MKLRIFTFLTAILTLLTSCAALKCERFYTYEAKKVDITGIETSLKKQGVDVATLNVGQIAIDPEYVVASDKLQELDLLQYTLCGQIKGLSRRDNTRQVIVTKYTDTLLEMLKVAQNPSSVSN